MGKTERRRNTELTHFLRSRRERITPEQAGLPETGRRRTPGLRRGEVAMLTGVSLEWYTFLEQGRSIHVSTEVLESLAVALRMNEEERKHLFLLAHQQPPPEKPVLTSRSPIDPALQRFLDELGTSPACVMDARMNIIAWNAAMCVLHDGLDRASERERNLLWHTFTSGEFLKMKGDRWEEHARRTVAQFRAEYARHVDDPWWNEQIAALSEASEQFREYWKLHDVLVYSNVPKIIYHPVAGKLVFDYLAFQPSDAPGLQVSIHIPLDDGTTKIRIQNFMGKV